MNHIIFSSWPLHSELKTGIDIQTFLLLFFSSYRISNSWRRFSNCSFSSVLRMCSCFNWDFIISSIDCEILLSTAGHPPRLRLFSKFSILSVKYFLISAISHLISSLISACSFPILVSTADWMTRSLSWPISLCEASDLMSMSVMITTFHVN